MTPQRHKPNTMGWLEDAETVACILTGTMLARKTSDAYTFALPTAGTTARLVVAEREPPGWLSSISCYYPYPGSFKFTPRLCHTKESSVDLIPTRLETEDEDELDPFELGRALAHLRFHVTEFDQRPGGGQTRPALPTKLPAHPSTTDLCNTLTKATAPSTVLRIASGYASGHDSQRFMVTTTDEGGMSAKVTTQVGEDGASQLTVEMLRNRITATVTTPGRGTQLAYGNFHQAMHFSSGTWLHGEVANSLCTVDHVVVTACRVAKHVMDQFATAVNTIIEV